MPFNHVILRRGVGMVSRLAGHVLAGAQRCVARSRQPDFGRAQQCFSECDLNRAVIGTASPVPRVAADGLLP
jgi:hypothetical protein